MKQQLRDYRATLEKDIGRYYRTRCTICGTKGRSCQILFMGENQKMQRLREDY